MPLLAQETDLLSLPAPLLAFLAIWFFAVGGCIGSFLNVVIYRWPRGQSIVSPPSRCPRCGAGIRTRHNLPVVGWLLLRGRCYDCQAPISARYPIVEFLVGLLFLLLALQSLLPGGPWWLLNEPWRGLPESQWPCLAIAYSYYQTLNVTLIAAAYIAWDRQRVPWKLYALALLLGLVAPLFWNEVRPGGVTPQHGWEAARLGLWHGAQGALVGGVLGFGFDFVRRVKMRTGEVPGRLEPALVTCGLMLGWSAVLIIAAASAVLSLLWLLVTARRWAGACSAPLVGVALATIGLTLCGRLFWEAWQPVASGHPVIVLVGGGGLLMLSALLQRALSPLPPPHTSE
jgi:leader peptidase (prepilin peptidase)/N-methyltransferase